MQALRRHRLIIQARQHHQRDAWRRGMSSADGAQPLSVRQARIEDYDIDHVLGEIPLGIDHAFDMHQLRLVGHFIHQHLTNQPDVSGIVFHQQNFFTRTRAHTSGLSTIPSER